MCERVTNATLEGCRIALVEATEQVRVVCLKFEQQTKQRFCEILRSKLKFWQELPYAFQGLSGMYMGHSLAECVRLARHILAQWNDIPDKPSMHRITIEFFSCDRLVTQLGAFIEGGRGLHQFPDLFLFVFRYATLTVVSHYVEGRHRQISFREANLH